uniref:Ubiquinone biosynthesis protein n=1 Tax=Candidatus Kentrum sp. MB TaxID=2138164 RepID=A0A450WYD1_9GAMM|nr:MAG: ubiquinone biosynthesis protein [Candidatus Kentron sp. MB]
MMPPSLQDFDISSLVPEEYAAYRSLVAETMVFFLERLSHARLIEIIMAQNRLDADANIIQRLGVLLRLCPTLHKLGQVLARNRKLAPALRKRLQALESMEAATPLFTLIPTIERELGRDTFSGIRLAERPIAEASVAVVVPFSCRSPKEQRNIPQAGGVLKVLKPGIEERLDEELEIWAAVAVFLDERCQEIGLPNVHFSETLDAVRELLSNEIKLDREQEHLDAANHLYAGLESVRIPSLLPFSTPRITAMERIFGHKVTEVSELSEQNRKELAKTVIEALIVRPACSDEHTAMFHADPHAGNLFITDDNRLAVLDWSLVGHLGKRERELMAQLLLGAITFDIARVVHAIEGLAYSRPNHDLVWKITEIALRRLHPHKFPGFNWLVKLLDDAKLLAGVHFPKDLLLFRKTILTLEGVIADICPNCRIGKILPLSAVQQFLHELLKRSLCCSPLSRAFGTHVSNLDLMNLYWSLPMGIGLRWLDLVESRVMRYGTVSKDKPSVDAP